MAIETDSTYALGAEYYDAPTETAWQYIHSICHPEDATLARFEGKRGELPVRVRIECAACNGHIVTLPLARSEHRALLSWPAPTTPPTPGEAP